MVDRCNFRRRQDQLQQVNLLRIRPPLGGLGEVDRNGEATLRANGGDWRHIVIEAVLILQLTPT